MAMLVFPGQGSQKPGMGKFLFENFGLAKECFDEGSEALKLDLKQLCFNASESDLALTENTQPALLVTSTATQKVLRSEFGVQPSMSAGHSVGEYAALVAAGVLDFAAAIRAVRIRGQAMQSAVPTGKGGMAALMGLEPQQAEELCAFVEKRSGKSPLSPANFNCPGQIVVSGAAPAIEWLRTEFKVENLWGETGPTRVKVIPLQVSAPFHCAMMKPAEEKMREVLSAIPFKNADFGIIQNFQALVETQAEQLKENLIRQISAPVRWTQSMQEAQKLGFTQIIECGGGKVLAGLLKKISPDFQVYSTNSLDDLKLIESLAIV